MHKLRVVLLLVGVVTEEMVQRLQGLPWVRVDLSFRTAFWPFFAHNNIHVKQQWVHFEGAGVINHVVDMVVEQEVSSGIHARL